MSSSPTLALLATLPRRLLVRGGAVVAFGVVERVALAFAAGALVERAPRTLALLLGGVLVARVAGGACATGLRAQLLAWALARGGAGALGAPPLEPLPLEGRDAGEALVVGAYEAETQLGARLPHLVADVVALPLAAWVAVTTLERSVLGVAAAATAVAVVLAAGVRRRVGGAAERAYRATEPLARRAARWVASRDEIVASGRAGDELGALAEEGRLASRRRAREDAVAAVLARAPLVVAALVAGALLAADLLSGARSLGDVVALGVALAALGAPLVGVVRAGIDLVRAEARLVALAALARSAEGAADPPARASVRSIELSAVAAGYGDAPGGLPALSASFSVGGVHAVAGANGAGKSTLLRVLAGLLEPRQGTLLVDGAAASARSLRGAVAYLPQAPHEPAALRVAEVLRLHAPQASDAELARALEDVRLPSSVASTPLEALSGGRRRRVLLARLALAPAPVMVLDEPDQALDDEGLDALAELLARWARDRVVVVAAHAALLARLPEARRVDVGRGAGQRGVTGDAGAATSTRGHSAFGVERAVGSTVRTRSGAP